MLTLLIMITFLFSQQAFALSTVTAVIDKNPAMLNESILLTVTADDDVARNALDTSPLLKDFIVGQTSVSSQTSMVNFETSRMTKWQVILIARKAGELTIPALTIDNKKSKPIAVTVVEAKNNSSANSQADIFITSELSSEQVYVQQALTLSIKLHFSVELQSASLTEPELTGATIEKAAKDEQSDSIINGKRYRVIEQTYAITPEQSGDFTLAAPVFSGEVRQASNRRSSFLSFGQSKPVSIVGKALNLNVLPIPTDYPSNTQWLPTEILTLHQEWQGNDDKFTVGEPITRTITLTAAGLSKAQLPELVMQSTQGLKIYPDQSESHSTLRENRLISQKVQNFAIVPSAPGDFTLPAMEVTWFNIITNKIEKATLPAKTITVQASPDGFSNNQANSQQSTNPLASLNLDNNIESENNQLANQPGDTSITSVVVEQDKTLQWLFLTLWLVTTLAWILHVIYLKKNAFTNTSINSQSARNLNNGEHYLALLAACKKNDAEQTLNLILPWLKQLLQAKAGIEISNIAQAQNIIQSEEFTLALNDLQQRLYGKTEGETSNEWQGLALFNAIQSVNKQQSKSLKVDPLQSLNP
ncbi:protein BatD [Colwellia echini]|uniref:Protein BatD n=1 Tax=Colwellia echini TaxID=1982103 RepID=A0ABY3MT00_9GAMM|nr:protein BatD [Colwellia echini]